MREQRTGPKSAGSRVFTKRKLPSDYPSTQIKQSTWPAVEMRGSSLPELEAKHLQIKVLAGLVPSGSCRSGPFP